MEQEVTFVTPQNKWTREAGSEPIPGYRLLEPLGKGGFGEVWKCEAPGGLFKAVKFVASHDSDDGPANQERQALQLVKAIRHPFILSLERVEVVDGVLVIVTELADKSLHELLADYQSQRLSGIPREELLGYLMEAAEALDWMSFRHGLQHLDIKPHNLFVVSNHVKVADFGLVDRLTDVEKTPANQRQGGVTPLYASPELLRGRVSRQCDQYSLAIVYQQLLTGTVPIWGQNLYELIALHMTGEPNLTPLPTEDRPVVARALSKRPADRYPSCLDFIQALVCGSSAAKPASPRRSALVQKSFLEFAPRHPNPAKAPRRTPESCPTVHGRLQSREKTPQSVVRALPASDESDGGKSDSEAYKDHAHETPTPTCVSLPGYRFLNCVSQSPHGDIWNVEDEQGVGHRALCLPPFITHDSVRFERLQSLVHPALPATEVFWSPSGRLVLITEHLKQSLFDRLAICQKEGLPGIPREELLGYLRTAAEALDTLNAQNKLPHLGLNPWRLMLRDGQLWMFDYGLTPLLWMPAGLSMASVNGRYAAPELIERPDLTITAQIAKTPVGPELGAGSAADQFSLALIYAEMTNGIAPSLQRFPALRRLGSSQTRISRLSDSGQYAKPGQSRIDFDLLPSCDRGILQKALHNDPQKRYSSCTEMINALEAAANSGSSTILSPNLPTILPFGYLKGEPPSEDIALPTLYQFVINLAMPNLVSSVPPRAPRGAQNARCTLLANDVWESKCPIQIFSGALALKVEGFCNEWNGHIVEQNKNSFLFHLDLSPPAQKKDPDKSLAPIIAVQLDVHSPASTRQIAEARMRVFPAGGNRLHIARLLPELAPRLFSSMRSYLHAAPDQRSEDRWTCPQPLHVYPVKPQLELDEALEGISRNISLGGVSFRILEEPRTEQAYLHWHRSPAVSSYAVLVRIIRVQSMASGGFEVGGVF